LKFKIINYAVMVRYAARTRVSTIRVGSEEKVPLLQHILKISGGTFFLQTRLSIPSHGGITITSSVEEKSLPRSLE
jgi:hypothetical protein